ncbi:MAG: TIGR01459 family HAD-type hydrolase [Pseudomonadota bacterium]
MTAAPIFIEGLGEIADRFDHVLLDQWGVLHDGRQVFEAASDCVRRLAETGKTVVVLSNSGKRAAPNAARLTDLGLPPSAYRALVSAGEVTWEALCRRDAPPFDRLERRCFLIARGHDRSIIEDLEIVPVERIEEASFLLLAGLDEERAEPELWRPLLAAAAARGLLMVCANPDLTVYAPWGLVAGPGTLARLYEELGGRVTYVGKPYPQIYAHCLRILGGPAPDRVLAIGDSLDHDVAGGNRAGLVTAFVSAGVLAPSFADARTPGAVVETTLKLGRDIDKRPRWVMRVLAW